MSMKLSSDKEHLVLDNKNLIHYLLQKLGVTPNSSDYEDIVSIGTIGLIKAAITFDTSRNIAFSTYASRCINNEIFMHYKKANKYANDISIDEPIGDDGKGNKLPLADTIADSKPNFAEKIVEKEEFIKVVSTILNYLEGKHRIVLLYKMADVSQIEIAKKLNIAQSSVSRIQIEATQKIQKIENQPVHYKEVFSMEIVGDEYRISFSSKEISKFNKIFATLLQNLTSVENLPDFKVNYNKERIIIQIPAHPNSFAFVAQIIQEIDDFSMSFVSNKTTVYADIETNSHSTVQEGSQVKQVREYMLSMNSFTVKDLKLHFPNFTDTTFKNALYLAKGKGLITAISRGKYVVNKT